MDVSTYRVDWKTLMSTVVSDKNTTWVLFGVDEEGGTFVADNRMPPKSFALFLFSSDKVCLV